MDDASVYGTETGTQIWSVTVQSIKTFRLLALMHFGSEPVLAYETSLSKQLFVLRKCLDQFLSSRELFSATLL